MRRLITDIEVIPNNIYYSFSIKSRLNNLLNKYSYLGYFISSNYLNGDKIYISFLLYNEQGEIIDVPNEIAEYYKLILNEPEWSYIYGYNNLQNYSNNYLKTILPYIENILIDYEIKMNEEGLLINLSNYANYLPIYEILCMNIDAELQKYVNYAYNPTEKIIEEWNMTKINDDFYKVNINEMFYKSYENIFNFFEYMKMNIGLFKISLDELNEDTYKKLKDNYNITFKDNILILKEFLTFDIYLDIISIIKI